MGAGLQYQREEGGAPPLLYDPLDPELAKRPLDAQKFKAQRSLRDVEPSAERSPSGSGPLTEGVDDGSAEEAEG